MTQEKSEIAARKAKRLASQASFQYGKIEEHDRSFDIAYWQSLTAAERLAGAWELVEYYLIRKVRQSELRLQRSVVDFPKL